MIELTEKLVEVFGPSGFEEKIRDIVRQEVEPYADEITVDPMGNLIARKKGDGSGLKVMIAAHLDEIGVMANHLTKEGFVRFTNIGGLYPHNLMGARVQFANGTIGVVYSDRLESFSKIHGVDKHYIDVGAASREDCPIEVGAAGGFVRPFAIQGTRMTSKAMDDRIGCVVGIEALKQLKDTPHDVYFVFSVQEEVGTRGAQASANGLMPEVGIALDVTGTGDTPESRTMAVKLGAGPAIKVKDAGMISHAGLVKLMRQRAEEAGLDYQLEVLTGGSTDARSMQIAGPGCAAGCISIPCRYIHSQSEMVDTADVEGCIKLLLEILQNPIDL
jgi:endoglucanase